MENNLSQQVVAQLKEKNLTIAVAESLTGGLVTKSLTDIPGSSIVIKGSITAYIDEIKIEVLNIDSNSIKEHTSISEVVALQMAQNVRKIMKSDIGISTTGVAGPEKSSGFEPGLVFVAISGLGHNMCQKLELKGDRTQIREQSVAAVLKLILSALV